MDQCLKAYKGPVILMASGGGTILFGAIPIVFTLATGIRSAAAVFGLGFVAFGIILLVPGMLWCMYRKHRRSKWWRCGKDKVRHPDSEGLHTPALGEEHALAAHIETGFSEVSLHDTSESTRLRDTEEQPAIESVRLADDNHAQHQREFQTPESTQH